MKIQENIIIINKELFRIYSKKFYWDIEKEAIIVKETPILKEF